MDKVCSINVEELSTFMNVGWPGDDWYLTDHPEYLWETTFTTGEGTELYRARDPDQAINLYDYDGKVSWQGCRSDPTRGRGHRLSDLFLRWQQSQQDIVVVARVPREKMAEVLESLDRTGCVLVTTVPKRSGASHPVTGRPVVALVDSDTAQTAPLA
jgi:hypothetical protein